MKRLYIFLLFCAISLQLPALTYVKYLKVGESYACVPNILFDRTFSWSVSGNSGGALSISGNYSGSMTVTVVARKAGWATITCDGYSKDGTRYYSDIWSITVESNEPTAVYMSFSHIEIDVGESASLSASISPADAEYSFINWSSSNTGVASVSGSGLYATVTGTGVGETSISATTDNGVSGVCDVKVWGTSPTSISLSGVSGIYIGNTQQLYASFIPDGHHSSVSWASDNTKVATVSQSGLVTALSSGMVTITATTANGLKATKTITVTEPPFSFDSTDPVNGKTDVSVLVQPSAVFSLNLYEGKEFSGIALYEGTTGNTKVAGSFSISGKELRFKPSKALKPYTAYSLSIPANALKNEWGTAFPTPIAVNFTTGALLDMTLGVSEKPGYVNKGDAISLIASETDAEIRYTLDGTEPSEKSRLYTTPVTVNNPVTLWAKAFKDGYVTPQVKAEYKISLVKIVTYYPGHKASPLDIYNYNDVNPYIEYEVETKPGPEFDKIKVELSLGDQYDVSCNPELEDRRVTLDGEIIISGVRVVFVPKQPLRAGNLYYVTIPESALLSYGGEPNKSFGWSFRAGKTVESISAGYEQACAVQGHRLLYWGRKYNDYQGGYYTDTTYWSLPSVIDNYTGQASCGFMHNMFVRTDGTVYGSGLQYCGETATGRGTLVSTPGVSIMADEGAVVSAGGQTSSLIAGNTFAMAGRNDFGQVGNPDSVSYSDWNYIDIPGSVVQAVPAWQTSFALTDGGTLYAWGYNGNGLVGNGRRKDVVVPQVVMNGVQQVSASRWDNSNAAALTADGKLFVWGRNDYGQLGMDINELSLQPVLVMDDVCYADVASGTVAAIKTDASLWMWGNNRYGQLGNGNSVNSAVPQKVMEDVESVSLGDGFTVVLLKNGSVWTWGKNNRSQLGKGNVSYFDPVPEQVIAGRQRADAQGILLSDTAMAIAVGRKYVICAQPVPLQADYGTWTWSSGNKGIATVSERGVVTGVTEGTTLITVSDEYGNSASCSVTVSPLSSAAGIKMIQDIEDVYDLNGRKMQIDGVNDLWQLPKGVYIIDGKKQLNY